MRCILLNPGPVSLSDAVRRAAFNTDLGHHEPEFFELVSRVKGKLIDAYELDADGRTWYPFDQEGVVAALARRVLELEREAADLRKSNDELSRIAVTDNLTQLGNRRYLSSRLEALAADDDKAGIAEILEALTRIPSAAGIALGLDRLIMVFGNQNRIDEVVAFTPEEL